MTLLETLNEKVAQYLEGDYQTSSPRTVPNPEDIPLGNGAAELTATALFIDVRQSSDITNAFRRQTAAKMMKAYFDGTVRIVNANEGQVRSFNGDGLLALFIGDFRSSNAAKAAMQVSYFVSEILGGSFSRYFAANRAAVGNSLDFSVGAGLDDGVILAVRVGIQGTNDVAWVGRCTNTAAKLAGIMPAGRIAATREVFNRLHESRKFGSQTGASMWSDERLDSFGGIRRGYRTSGWTWRI